VPHVSTCIFQRLFKNTIVRSVALVFFSKTGLFSTLCPALYIFKKIFFKQKNPLKFHGDSVKNESARTKNLPGGAKRPPPRLFMFN